VAQAEALLRERQRTIGGKVWKWNESEQLREALFDFIADFSNWDNSNDEGFLETARSLTQAAHESLGGVVGARPMVVDPFAGGGAIPLETLRVGAEALASDLNPVALLINKVTLDYAPRFGPTLIAEVRKWAKWMKDEAHSALADYYPVDPDGCNPVAYLWAHTVLCEGPGCGAEIPLIRSPFLTAKGPRAIGLRLIPNHEQCRVDIEIAAPGEVREGVGATFRRGAATCPLCGVSTPVDRVRAQLMLRHGGAHDARLLCVVTTHPSRSGRVFRLPTQADLDANAAAMVELDRQRDTHTGHLSLVPDEALPQHRIWKNNPIRVHLYGMTTWTDLFTPRQALGLATLSGLVRRAQIALESETDQELARAVASCLGLLVDKLVDSNSVQVWWMSSGEKTVGTFTRQALSFIADFAEIPITDAPSRSIDESAEWICRVIEHVHCASAGRTGHSQLADAANQLLPDGAADALITDPPYYDAVPYATLADFFYVWLRRSGIVDSPNALIQKAEECVVDEGVGKNGAFFEKKIGAALKDSRRVVKPDGIGVVVFAHKSTAGWEALLQGLIESGWVVTATWPIDTERQVKVNTINRAFLGSSIHLVCRPRQPGEVGNWRQVLNELPGRIHQWMPRLAAEGVVGADAVFACLGPALEIFSRYERVEKASGEVVPLRDYLEHVWAAVSREALAMIFHDPETSGLEEDARLTAMWLWTLAGPSKDGGIAEADGDDEDGADDDEDGGKKKTKTAGGFVLEYDAARKIAQGLGCKLESLPHLVEVKGDSARLLPVSERTRHLFGKDAQNQITSTKPVKKKQLGLFASPEEEIASAGWGDLQAPAAGITTLDRIHQAMLLFAAGRSEGLKRFLVDDGTGAESQFWKLAQALSALYPPGTDEKRWVDGVLARKKGLGFG